MSSPARVNANRINATRSTGPRTAEGKAASSRNALSHGAYASDDTLLAAHGTPLAPGAEQTQAVPGATPQADPTAENDGPTLLASFTAHYTPAGPAETLLVRRIVAASLRIDLLERAFDALMELGERRALIDHLAETYAINEPKLQVRDAPNYAAMLRRYDGAAELPPDFDPSLDPDPALCNLAYTLSSPRAAALMRHEATAERRLHTAMRELHRLQAARRAEEKARNKANALASSAPLPTPVAGPSTPTTARARSGFSPSHPSYSPNHPIASRQLLDAAIDAFLHPTSATLPPDAPLSLHPRPATPPRDDDARPFAYPMPATSPHENAFAYPTQATPRRENEANTLLSTSPTIPLATPHPRQSLRPTPSTADPIGPDQTGADLPPAYHD